MVGLVLMIGDSLLEVLNTSVPFGVLKKKHCAINFDRACETIATKVLMFAMIPCNDNLADIYQAVRT